MNLFEFFSHRDDVSEVDVAAAVRQLVSALSYLHQSNVAHLDIKVCIQGCVTVGVWMCGRCTLVCACVVRE